MQPKIIRQNKTNDSIADRIVIAVDGYTGKILLVMFLEVHPNDVYILQIAPFNS